MSRTSRAEMEAYMERHRIRDLLRDMTEELVFTRPEQPLRLLHQKLTSLLGPDGEGGGAEGGGASAGGADNGAGSGGAAPAMFALQVHVEAVGPGGSVVRHVAKRGLHAPQEVLRGWADEAAAALAAACDCLVPGRSTAGSAQAADGEALVDALQAEVEQLRDELDTEAFDHKDFRTKALSHVQQLEQEVATLKAQLAALQGGSAGAGSLETQSAPDAGVGDGGGAHPKVQFELDVAAVVAADVVEAATARGVQRLRKARAGSIPARPRQATWAGSAMRIICLQDVTDVHNLSVFDSVVRDKRDANTIVVIPGDLLGVSVASILDKGVTVIELLNQIGVDVVTLGSSEATVPPELLSQRMREFKGKWLNSNLPNLPHALPEFEIVEVRGTGGAVRKVGLVGICTHGNAANVVGEAWKTPQQAAEVVARLKKTLVEECGCDLVVPLTNQAMQADEELAKAHPDLPVIIGAHDHEPAVRLVAADEGGGATTIVKAGLHHNLCAVVDLVWGDAGGPPQVHVEKVRLDDYFANEELEARVANMQQACRAVRSVTLCAIPEALRPLSSKNSRRRQTSVGTLVCNLCCSALACDGAAISGAVFRGDREYPRDASHLTYNDLIKELPGDTAVTVVQVPGSVLAAAVSFSRQAARQEQPADWGGFYQLSESLGWDDSGAGALTLVKGQAVDLAKVYCICLLYDSVMGVYRNQPLIDWVNHHPQAVPRMEAARYLKDIILIDSIARGGGGAVFDYKSLQEQQFVTREEAAAVLEGMMGGGGDKAPAFLVDNMMKIVDTNNDGKVDRNEFHQVLRVFDKMQQLKNTSTHCSLRIISVNDVYEIINFPRLHNLILDHKVENTIVVLPGDFVAPSLLSSLDRGKGMIDMMNRVGGTGIDYVCFGNHENDIPPEDLRQRIAEFKGKWINSNMPAWQPALPEYAIIEIQGNGQTRRIGLLGLNTVDKNLYRPGAFDGAMDSALPVVDTAVALRKKLVEEERCDLVIPMTHQVMAEDRQMAEAQLGFPLLIGAHDHDPYLEQVAGATIVKTGADANMAAIIDVSWASADAECEVKVDLVETKLYPPDAEMTAAIKVHLKAVDELESAYLAPVDPTTVLYSTKMRRQPTPVGIMLTSLIRDGFRSAASSMAACDGVMMDAGGIRRNFDYPEGYTIFTFGDLKKEIPFPSEMVVVSMPGSVINAAVSASRARAFNDPPEDWGGYLQLDDGFTWDAATNSVTHVNLEPIDMDKQYQIAVLYLSLSGMNRNQPLIDFANTFEGDAFTQLGDAGRGAKELIVDCCARHILAQLGTFDELDADHSGTIDITELEAAMSKMLGREVAEIEKNQVLNSLRDLVTPRENGGGSAFDGVISKQLFGKAMQAHLVSMGSSSKLINANDSKGNPSAEKS